MFEEVVASYRSLGISLCWYYCWVRGEEGRSTEEEADTESYGYLYSLALMCGEGMGVGG